MPARSFRSLLVALCVAVQFCYAQKTIWTTVIIDPTLKIDTSFNRNWSYPWYVVKHEDGHFENTLVDTITEQDTAHLFFTAACTNTHLGSHTINYCRAATYNDDVEMSFSGRAPSYNEEIAVVIRKGKFSVRYNFQSIVALVEGIEESFEIISKKMVLKRNPIYGSTTTGTLEIKFRGKIKTKINKITKKRLPKPVITYSKIYVLKGRFYTRLDKVIDIE